MSGYNRRPLRDLAGFDMGFRKRHVCCVLMAMTAFAAHPAFATNTNCHPTRDPATRMICAHPQLRTLDARLASAYAAAMARNPAHAGDLKQDQINWLGERNRQIAWLQASQQDASASPGDLEKVLADFYRTRIAFLRNIGNPTTTRNRPIAQKLLDAAKAMPAHANNTLKALQAAGTLVLPKEHDTDDPAHTIATLAAPPDAALRSALHRFGPRPFTVVYLPGIGLGGAFNIEGTADCQNWVVFEKRGKATIPIGGDGPGLLDGCARDKGSTSYLALMDGHPVALNVTNPPSFSNETDIQWQRWSGTGKWSPALLMRFRYGYHLKLASQGDCISPSPQCAPIAHAAMGAAQRYMRNAPALASLAGKTATERARFRHMLQLAPRHTAWAYCTYPVWFPVRLEGKTTVGGVTRSHIACHPDGNSLDVVFWRISGNGRQHWLADDIIHIDRGKLLSAALVSSPGKDP